MKHENFFARLVSTCLHAFGKLLELVGTLLYYELLKRNTVQRMMDIINESQPKPQRRLLRK